MDKEAGQRQHSSWTCKTISLLNKIKLYFHMEK
jgi:hypothetical protein